MKPRPIRPNVYHEIKRCGIYQGDWKFVLIPTAAAYLLPFTFNLWIYYIPLVVPAGVLTFIVLLSMFSFLRASKPKGWLAHYSDAATDGWSKLRTPTSREHEISDWVGKN